ncbi:hypothetical protein NQ317_011251, partial [Molorchus minor]
MSDYSGEDLLNIFNDLAIRLLNLNPNVVKAWFDTDDKNMKSLLTWMCTSLSKKNYISPLEYAEFSELEAPLVDEKYERELKSINSEYPGLFDIDSNIFEIEFIEDEIDLILEEERNIDELIRMNEIIQNNLSKELTSQTSMEIETCLNFKTQQELCNSLSEELDNINKKLHTQLTKYGSNLFGFEFSPIPTFINNMDIKKPSFYHPTAQVWGADTYLDSINSNDSIYNNLITMRGQDFLNSHQELSVLDKIEVDKFRGNIDILKSNQHGICYNKTKSSLNKIETIMIQCLCQYILLKMLYSQEKKDIDNSDKFLLKLFTCIIKFRELYFAN